MARKNEKGYNRPPENETGSDSETLEVALPSFVIITSPPGSKIIKYGVRLRKWGFLLRVGCRFADDEAARRIREHFDDVVAFHFLKAIFYIKMDPLERLAGQHVRRYSEFGEGIEEVQIVDFFKEWVDQMNTKRTSSTLGKRQQRSFDNDDSNSTRQRSFEVQVNMFESTSRRDNSHARKNRRVSRTGSNYSWHLNRRISMHTSFETWRNLYRVVRITSRQSIHEPIPKPPEL